MGYYVIIDSIGRRGRGRVRGVIRDGERKNEVEVGLGGR